MDFKERSLSASMIETFLQCKKKFYKRYILGKRPTATVDHLSLGSAFHAAMEQANRVIREDPRAEGFTKEETEKFLYTFRRLLAKLGLSDMSILLEGEELVTKMLSKMDTESKILDTEVEFNIVTSDGVPILGFIDLVKELSPTELLIKDYKTSRIAKSSQEARDDVQLAMYDFAASVVYPKYKDIWLELDYVRSDKPPLRVKRTQEQRDSFIRFLKAVYDEMLEYSFNDEPKGSINEYCAYCDYRNSCKEYGDMLRDFSPNLTPVELMSEEDLVGELEVNNNVMKAVDSRNSQIKLRIINKVEEGLEEELCSEKSSVYITQATKKSHDIETVISNIPTEDLVNYGIINSIANKGLDKYFLKNPNRDLQKLIDERAEVKFNNPSIRLKKNNKMKVKGE